MTEHHIRPATEADLPGVRACLVETWHATYDPIFGAAEVTAITNDWHSIEALRANLQVPESVFLVAGDAAAITGTVSARMLEPGLVRLGRLYVLPSAQRRGLGAALLGAVTAAFPNLRCLRLEVEPRNLSAIAFYEAQGFMCTGEVPLVHGADPALALEKNFVAAASSNT